MVYDNYNIIFIIFEAEQFYKGFFIIINKEDKYIKEYELNYISNNTGKSKLFVLKSEK